MLQDIPPIPKPDAKQLWNNNWIALYGKALLKHMPLPVQAQINLQFLTHTQLPKPAHIQNNNFLNNTNYKLLNNLNHKCA